MNQADTYRVVYVEPGKPACVREIGKDLKSLQEAVAGGPIECVYAHQDDTVIMYFPFHVFKWQFAATSVIWWLYGMISVVGIYTLSSVWLTYTKIREYRKVENLATIDENTMEGRSKSNL